MVPGQPEAAAAVKALQAAGFGSGYWPDYDLDDDDDCYILTAAYDNTDGHFRFDNLIRSTLSSGEELGSGECLKTHRRDFAYAFLTAEDRQGARVALQEALGDRADDVDISTEPDEDDVPEEFKVPFEAGFDDGFDCGFEHGWDDGRKDLLDQARALLQIEAAPSN